MSSSTNIITVGARSSPLSKAQVAEIQRELNLHHPDIVLEPIYVETSGDKDLKTSLRSMDRTDFFTKEVDAMLLSGTCQIAIHSAKDLPEPIAKGLSIICITKGVDASDSLVLRQGERLESLPSNAIIATSSERREMAVRSLRHDVIFRDVRGTIGARLALLENGQADGVVIAEAALIRLGLTHLNRLHLPGTTVPLQGQLAIVTRSDDHDMTDLFASMNVMR